MAKVFSRFICGGQLQLRLGIWQRFITSLLVADRSTGGCGFGRGLLQFISDGKMKLRLEDWQRFITSLLVMERCS